MTKIFVIVMLIITTGVLIFWLNIQPPTPVKWALLQIGMTRREVYKTLDWPDTDYIKSIETEQWNYNPILYRCDKKLEIEYIPTTFDVSSLMINGVIQGPFPEYHKMDKIKNIKISDVDDWNDWIRRIKVSLWNWRHS